MTSHISLCFFITRCAPSADQGSEGQSNEARTSKEQEEQKAQDGSLWWHGMFVRAGRMGNMAADVQAGSKPEVCALSMQASTRHTSCTNVVTYCPSAVLVSAGTKSNQHLFLFNCSNNALYLIFYIRTDSVSGLQHLHWTQPCHVSGLEMGCCPHSKVGVSICHMQGHFTWPACEYRFTGRLRRATAAPLPLLTASMCCASECGGNKLNLTASIAYTTVA